MVDYGLLAGIGEGLRSGLESYRQERDYQGKLAAAQKQAEDEKRNREIERALKMKQLGIVKTGDQFEFTPEQERSRAMERAAQQASLLKSGHQAVYDEDKKEYTLQRLEGYLTDSEKFERELALKAAAIRARQDRYKDKPAKETTEQRLDRLSKETSTRKLTEKATGLTFATKQLSSAIKQLRDPHKTDKDKIAIGKQILKTLNDPINSDAVGAEEVARLGAELEILGSYKEGSLPGRNIEQFIRNVENNLARVEDTRAQLRSIINEEIHGQPKGLLPSEQQSGGYLSPPGREGDVREDGSVFKGGKWILPAKQGLMQPQPVDTSPPGKEGEQRDDGQVFLNGKWKYLEKGDVVRGRTFLGGAVNRKENWR